MTPSQYLLRRPRPADRGALAAFAREIWPNARPGKLDRRWWWHDSEPQSWIAEHGPSGAVAAMCGERRTRICVDGQIVPASAICDWDVSPQHKGLSLGRALVEASAAGHPIMYTTSISDSAATAFARLGWAGDERVPVHAGAPLLTAALSLSRGLTTRRLTVSANRHGGLEHADALWSTYTPKHIMQPRDARHLRDHLRLAPHRTYDLTVGFRGGTVVGWVLHRMLPSGSFRRLPFGRVGLLVDFLFRDDAPEFVAALVHDAARSMVLRGCVVTAALTTEPGIASAFHRLGLVSANAPLLGRYLTSATNRCMHWSRGALPSFSAGWYLTFADNDMDLIFGSDAEAPPQVVANLDNRG